jgi:hypothetical protein
LSGLYIVQTSIASQTRGLAVARAGTHERRRTTLGSQRQWRIISTGSSLAGVRAAAMAGLAMTPLPLQTTGPGLRVLDKRGQDAKASRGRVCPSVERCGNPAHGFSVGTPDSRDGRPSPGPWCGEEGHPQERRVRRSLTAAVALQLTKSIWRALNRDSLVSPVAQPFRAATRAGGQA